MVPFELPVVITLAGRRQVPGGQAVAAVGVGGVDDLPRIERGRQRLDLMAGRGAEGLADDVELLELRVIGNGRVAGDGELLFSPGTLGSLVVLVKPGTKDSGAHVVPPSIEYEKPQPSLKCQSFHAAASSEPSPLIPRTVRWPPNWLFVTFNGADIVCAAAGPATRIAAATPTARVRRRRTARPPSSVTPVHIRCAPAGR
jgi:hypothetical protein